MINYFVESDQFIQSDLLNMLNDHHYSSVPYKFDDVVYNKCHLVVFENDEFNKFTVLKIFPKTIINFDCTKSIIEISYQFKNSGDVYLVLSDSRHFSTSTTKYYVQSSENVKILIQTPCWHHIMNFSDEYVYIMTQKNVDQ
jgi:hypothetical protein